MAWLSDEEYVYQQDIKEKKSAGRGAFHKKCGSKSKKCTLPSDHMTKKEREAMNGAVFHYDPRKWYTWEEFKAMPMEYQIKYCNSLINRYDIGLTTISTVLFGLNKNTLNIHFRRADQLQYINTKTGGHGKTFKLHGEKMKADMEKDLWPNHDEEIQNESKEVPLSMEEKVKQASDTIDLYLSRGMQVTPKIINSIYEEKTGMSFALAMEFIGKDPKEMTFTSNGSNVDSEIPNIYSGDPIGKVEHVLETEHGLGFTVSLNEGITPEDVLNPRPVEPKDSTNSTDVQSFSIVMDHIDQDIINYIAKLFDGKKVSVTIDVKQQE